MTAVNRALLLTVVLIGVATGCAADDAGPQVSADAGFAEIGEAPGPVTGRTSPAVPDIDNVPTVAASTTTVVELLDPVEIPIGPAAGGTGLLLIGDDVLAATADRNDGTGCTVLTEFGWDVEIAAEPGRFVGFASIVLEARLAADPAVVGIMLGHRYDGVLQDYQTELRRTIETIGNRPVILFTLGGVYADDGTGLEASAVAPLNGVIESLGREFPNVVVVDWGGAATMESDLLLLDGGPSPTDDGARRLVVLAGEALTEAPGGGPDGELGECVDTEFDSDDAIIL